MGETNLQASNGTDSLMMQVLDRENLIQALKQVQRNKGAAGVDGMTVAELPDYLKHHWPDLKAQLLEGSYCPQPALRVEIPKPDGRKRKLGIPTVIDRLIQQAIAQVLSRIWEPRFHPNSYGFRPLRSAHQAVKHAQSEINHGKRWVVDIDFDSFFDRVNHDRLMQKLKAVIDDKTLLRLVNRYLKSGIELNGAYEKTTQGTPQGSPLSPLLSNIVLDELDWELDKRGQPCPLRGRLPDFRRQSPRRGTGKAKYYRLCREHLTAQGQCRQKRGRPSVETGILRLYLQSPSRS